MLDGQTTLVLVADESQVGEARRAMAALCQRQSLDDNACGAAALVTTEAATNLVKHAGGGEILLRGIEDGVEVLALDRGPGMADVGASLRDGHSTTGTQGNGLGAIRRMATTFDIYSAPGKGTALLARVQSSHTSASGIRLDIGAVSLPKSGETVNGDGWLAQPDGPGGAHPGRGRDRSWPHRQRCVTRRRRGLPRRARPAAGGGGRDLPSGLAQHAGGRSGRDRGRRAGGTGAFRGRRATSRASIWNGTVSHHTVSHNGTAGHGIIRIREFSYPWPKGALLVLASDGLATRWSLDDLSRIVGP